MITKYANRTLNNRWQWYVRDIDTRANVQLIAIENNGYTWHFVVPGSELADKITVQIDTHPTKTTSWLRQYLICPWIGSNE